MKSQKSRPSTATTWTVPVPAGNDTDAATLLAGAAGLSKRTVKDAMQKGAVWLVRGRRQRRLRRATSLPPAGSILRLDYAPDILARRPPAPMLLADRDAYSVWYKPAGLLSQGSRYGDHCAIERLATKELHRPTSLVHRLDRETGGIMLLAHHQRAAAELGRLFRDRRIQKIYLALVLGTPQPAAGTIDIPLDGKAASSTYATVARYADQSLVQVAIVSGRTHQVRRHLEAIGHPVIGDPRYGTGNKDTGGMRLVAYRLSFRCPFTGDQVDFRLPAATVRAILFGSERTDQRESRRKSSATINGPV